VNYADSSFLFSLYAQDANTASAAKAAGPMQSFVLTPLQQHEVRNAVRLSRFHGDMTTEQAERILSALADDVRTGVLVEAPLPWADVFAEAEALSAAHTPGLGTRALDILHVAAARVLGARRFLTFDSRQKALAKKAGLKVRA
jgi:hypothetical protein